MGVRRGKGLAASRSPAAYFCCLFSSVNAGLMPCSRASEPSRGQWASAFPAELGFHLNTKTLKILVERISLYIAEADDQR